jgi:hypothetical protein
MQESFSPAELHTTDLMALIGNIILFTGDPSSIIEDLHPMIDRHVVPEMLESVAAPKGV